MQFMELSLVVGKEILSFKEQLATLLIKTRSIRLNMLIQACSQHLYRRIHRDEPEALSKMQEQLRQNPYEAKVEMGTLCHLVLQVVEAGTRNRGGAIEKVVFALRTELD